ncbi:MAG TPA: YraN family protein [Candidatus Bipolaricaulota bacterium]|nr:YraN family protein [Candidatus Bipolaricaulota bacterium]
MTNQVAKGRVGEDIAARFLENKGCRIIVRNFKKLGGEIDLIAVENNSIVLCEVKSKMPDAEFSPEENISDKKIEKMLRVFEKFLDEYPEFEKFDPQIDLVFVELCFPPKIEHLENIMT